MHSLAYYSGEFISARHQVGFLSPVFSLPFTSQYLPSSPYRLQHYFGIVPPWLAYSPSS